VFFVINSSHYSVHKSIRYDLKKKNLRDTFYFMSKYARIQYKINDNNNCISLGNIESVKNDTVISVQVFIY